MNEIRKNLTKLVLSIFFLLNIQLFAQKAYGPLPSEAQLRWHEMEFYAFVHFNMNTFTGKEWGTGGESPEQFNPTDLDCRQWAKTFKEAGMKGIILTAKHHDGFCLWPTKTTEHSVKNSPWKNGKGDVVKELSEACKEYGLKFGVYLSPWDRNNANYGRPEYIDVFRGQLRELLTNYGDIFEVWFDGANGGSGYYGGANETRKIDGRSYYGWNETWAIVNELQPDAMIFGDGGPGIRWVGTEAGWANKTNWCLLRRDEVWPGWPRYKELRSGHEDGTHWVPAEVDVSIRPGWYYHKSEDHKVKSLSHLLDIYYHSVGRNATLLLNVPPDRRGLIHENDVKALLEFSKTLKLDFANELAKGQKTSATNVRDNSDKFSASKVNDCDKESYWATDDGVTDAALTIEFDKTIEFNRFLVQEYIRLGQRVKEFTVEAYVNGAWKLLAEETTIGYKRILRLPLTKTNKIRMHIKDAKACPLIANIEIYHAPKVLSLPEIKRTKSGMVSIIPADTGLDIYYTLDGSKPDITSTKYEKPFLLKEKAKLKAVCIDSETKGQSLVQTINFDICKEKWKVVYPKGKKKKSEAVVDDDKNSSWYIKAKEMPVELIVDLGEKLKLSGFTYLPDQSRWAGGYIFKYEFYVSPNGKKWGKAVSEGEFSNISNNPLLQKKTFDTKKGRYIKLKALSEANNEKRIGFAEIGIITE
jgi:alpha-L-fucosidase